MAKGPAPRGAIVWSLTLAVILSGISARATERAAALSGAATDVLGRALEGAIVRVLTSGDEPAVVAQVLSDAAGQFRIPALPPGRYRVLVSKPGFRSFLVDLDSMLGGSLTAVMRPAPMPGESPETEPPGDSAWVLRIPERTLLRSTGREALYSGESGAPPPRQAAAAAAPERLRGEFEHQIALLSLGSPESSGDRPDLQAAQTRMSVSSPVGGRGGVRVVGRRESSVGQMEATDGGGARQQGTDIQLDLALRTSREANLSVKTFFRRSDLAAGVAESSPTHRESQRAWGYDASWVRQLDAVSRLAVEMNYMDAASKSPFTSSSPPAAWLADQEPEGDWTRRTIGADGFYETAYLEGHRLRFGVGARLLDQPIRIPPVSGAYGAAIEWTQGWQLAIEAEDAWALVGPLTLTYGAELQQALDDQYSSLLVPRVGATWAPSALKLRFSVGYHVVRSGDSKVEAGLPVGTFRPERPWGWEAEAEAPLPGGLHLRGGTSYEPVQTRAPQGYPLLDSGAPGSIYVADVNAGVRSSYLGINWVSRVVPISFRWSEGEARGLVHSTALFDDPLLDPNGERRVGFSSGVLGLRVMPSRTEIAAEFRQLHEGSFVTAAIGPPETAPSELRQTYLELRVVQQILRIGWREGTCRVLLTARTAMGEGHRADPGGLDNARARILVALNRRLSAGLSLSF